MAQSTRQTNLLVNQDWTKVYQSFTNADFTSYDFETLRNSMINYLKTYYPETFNDFLESSEYLALIDMIAFLGQSLSFRTDLNARENFIDTAQRRDSILKLARMLSYNPTRTNSASGMLKIDSITTTENLTDSSGLNLSNSTIYWNDTTNSNWLEQFTTILNAALTTGLAIGKPANSQVINGIKTDEYTIALYTSSLPVAPFTVNIQNTPVTFEAVSASSKGQSYVYEVDPTNIGKFNILYRNDNNGNGSNNTGFFLYFKQGTLQASNFTIQNAIPNNFVPINTNNINNSDGWLYSLDVNNLPQTLWTPVPTLAGLNVIYNQATTKTLYQVATRNNDQVNLVFGDGAFATIPQGAFRYYYRTSNGISYTISPDDLAGVTVQLRYISAKGSVETLTVVASLKYTVTNASAAQSLTSIKTYAPQQYYTQNRMITGEDYNIFPLTTYTSIQKIKAVNRTSSGVSPYLDSLDPTGTFSTTNVICDDGNLFVANSSVSTRFNFLTTNDIYSAIYNKVLPLVSSTDMVNYYYKNSVRYSCIDSTPWTANTTFAANSFITNSGSTYIVNGNVNAPTFAAVVANTSVFNTGLTFFQTGNTTSSSWGTLVANGNVRTVGSYATGNLKYVNTGASLLFTNAGASSYATVTNVTGNTTVYFGKVVANGSVLTGTTSTTLFGANTIIPPYKTDFSTALTTTIATQIAAKSNFGLTFDQVAQTWVNIVPADIETTSNWLLKFTYNNGLYTIESRSLTYKFSSAGQTRFYYDPNVKVYNSTLGKAIADTIKILQINPYYLTSVQLGQDVTWNIYDVITEADGYVDTTTVSIKSPDSQMTGVPDNPDLYKLVANAAPWRDSLYFQYKHNSPGRNRIDPTPINLIDLYVLTADYATDYINYLRDMTGTLTEPIPPTSNSLEVAYSGLDDYKTVSDSLVYSSAKFKPLFGSKANAELQARFQVVVNPAVSLTPNEVKSQVIAAINAFFNVANWDFGDTFYFSELAAYLHTSLVPNIASIIIVPASQSILFGNYFQINAEPWEIITSAATVNDIDIITAVDVANLNSGTST